MQDSISPLIWSVILLSFGPIRLCMMVAVQASGLIVMSIGARVSSPPASLWWSMIWMMSASLIEAGSSAGLLVSTITTLSSALTSEMISGFSPPHFCRTKAASVLGSPSSFASAGWPRTSERYHAQISGEPVESVSGDLWPKTLIVMSVFRW